MAGNYGIGNRTPFINYSSNMTGTKQDALYHGATNKRYYSSIDAEIYFGDYYIDEIVQIVYQIEQQSLPLYGYSSYVFDEMALGSRIVTGSFTINLTAPGYLYSLLDQLESESVTSKSTQNVEKDDDGEEESSIGSTAQKTGSNSFTSTDYRSLKQSKRPVWYTGFDIDVMFGQDNTVGKAKHVLLEGVYLTGSSIGLDPSGNPITETYNFIARDLHAVD